MEKAERAEARLANFKTKMKGAVTHARHDGETIAAGALAGAIRGGFEASGKDYSIPGPNGTKIPPELPVGMLLLGAAYAKPSADPGDISNDLHAAGSGVLAYSAGREAEMWMKARGTKTPGAAQ